MNRAMNSVAAYMEDNHHRCDWSYSRTEALVAKESWDEAQAEWQVFSQNLLHHFHIEENILFPRFEQATGMNTGSTEVMRKEHQQIRNLMARMDLLLKQQNLAEWLELGETLMMLMQQHNMKKEQIFYPMADQVLDSEALVKEASELRDNTEIILV